MGTRGGSRPERANHTTINRTARACRPKPRAGLRRRSCEATKAGGVYEDRDGREHTRDIEVETLNHRELDQAIGDAESRLRRSAHRAARA